MLQLCRLRPVSRCVVVSLVGRPHLALFNLPSILTVMEGRSARQGVEGRVYRLSLISRCEAARVTPLRKHDDRSRAGAAARAAGLPRCETVAIMGHSHGPGESPGGSSGRRSAGQCT